MSVAIRAITRLQDADDVNVTPAVGVDEYALVYDHDTGKFVLRAPATPFDGTPYALLAGRAGGQTLYGGTGANDDITIHGTSDSTRATSYVLLQPTAGNVGIGTTGPSSILAFGPGTARKISIEEDGTGSTGTNLTLQAGGSSRWLANTSGGTLYLASGYTSGNGNSNIEFQTAFNQAAGGNTQVDPTTKMVILGSGNVGIGTTSPATALHVVGAATITGGIRPAADGTTALQFQNASGTSILNVDTTNARVGIGTTSPGALLEVNKSQDDVTAIRVMNANAGTSAFSRVAIGESPGAGNQLALTYANSGVTANSATAGAIGIPNSSYILSDILATGGLSITTRANAPIRFFTGGIDQSNERVRIDNAGNVGIGTTSPATALHVVGAATVTGGIRPAADSTTALQLQNVAGTSVLNVDTTNARVGIGTTSPETKLDIAGGIGLQSFVWSIPTLSSSSFIGSTSDGNPYPFDEYGNLVIASRTNSQRDIVFLTGNGSSSPTVQMVIKRTSGNVGINDTAPAEKLDVTGNINTTGVYKVDDVQVLSNRVIDARCADVANSGDATTDGLIDALRDAMIAHGLIAASA